jgi:flagellar biogenesis protein FliO
MKRARKPIASLMFCALLALAGFALADAPAPTAAAPAPHSAIPFKQETQSTDSLAIQSFALVVLAGLAAFGVVLGLKRFGGKFGVQLGGSRRVRTVEAIRLSRRSMLYVVEYQGQELLLAEGEHGVQLVSSRPLSASAAGSAAATHTSGSGDD